MSDLIRAFVNRMSPSNRAFWRVIAADVQIKEFASKGKRKIRLTHTPTGIVVTRVAGASMQESYLAAIVELIDRVNERGLSGD